MNILLSFNELGYSRAKEALITTGETAIQTVINEYLKLNIAPLETMELATLFKNPVELIFDKITGGQLSLGGIAVDKQKAIDIIQKPKGYSDFIALIGSTVKGLSEKLHQPGNFAITPDNIADYFELDVNQVKVKESVYIEFKEAFKSYAKSDKAKQSFQFANDVIDAFKKSGLVFHNDNNSLGSFINELVNSQLGQPMTVNNETILKFNR